MKKYKIKKLPGFSVADLDGTFLTSVLVVV